MSAPAQPEAPNHFDLPPERFEEAVADGLDAIPPELTDLMDNVVILIEDEARPADRDHPILGLYEGVPLTERGHSWASGSLPDRITLFRRPLLDFARQVDDEAPDACEDPDCLDCPPPPARPHTATQAREWFEEVLREEITTTVIHEVAHHFGISDERLYELGWD